MKIKNIIIVGLIFSYLTCACGNKTAPSSNSANAGNTQSYERVSPDFSADSAYHFVDRQVAFGPRVPNTKEHTACGDYLVSELKRYGADVIEQKAVLTAYNGTKLNARNIIGSYGKDKKNRVLLFAHWDSRPYSDHDPDPKNHRTPLLGANDGASGVGVLLEIARVIQKQEPAIGVDIIFFDAEDYGMPIFDERYDTSDTNSTWCLGSQYWAKNPHVDGYKARFGILLDMVGGKDAKFYRELYSRKLARDVVEKIWSTAGRLGYGKYFINQDGGGVMDDHVPVNQIRKIPSANIIDYDEKREKAFVDAWHTQADNMSNISRETLGVVGQTVLEVIYKEK